MKTKLKLIFFQLVLLFILLVILEVMLRTIGYVPGDMKPNWLNFKPVDSLYIVPDYYTNEGGILVADSIYWAKRNVYINSDGFRSNQFSQLDSRKKKILLIGDSFTWGMSANPFRDSCFADILHQETHYEVINLGIPATDPVQYLELVKKYVPQIKPDFALIFFFSGNDIMKWDRKVIPGEPFYYFTNAGAILADIDGIHFTTAQEAYNYFVNDKYYLRQPKNVIEALVAKSALLSRLYSIKFRIEEKIEYERMIKDTRITKKYLKGIQHVCSENKVSLKFVLIPEIKEADMNLKSYSKKYADLLLDDSLKGDWLLTQNSKTNFNDYPDAHLNNRGHRFYADYLKLFLKDFFGDK